LAARVETLGVVTQLTAKNAGYTTAELTGQAAAIRKLGITTEEATDSVLQFVRSNLNLADAAKLARVSQDLAVVAGKNSSQTYETLTRAIQTSETMLLRQFGIVTTNEQLWAAHARTLGKSVQQMSAVEKQQAFVNRILEEGAKVAGAYESSMETASKKMSSMARLTTELKLKLGNELLPAFTMIVGIVFSLLEALNKIDPVWIKIFAAVAAGVAAMASLASAITAVVAAAAAFMAVMGAAAGPVGLVAVALGVLTAGIVLATSSAEVSVAKLGEMSAELDVQTTTIEKANKTYTELTAKHVELGAKTEKQTKDQADLRKSIDDLAKAVPTARIEFDLLTQSYKLNEDEIQRVLKLNEDLRKSYEAAAGAQLLAQQRELSHTAQDKAKAQLDVNRARDNLAQAEKDLAELTKQIEQQRAGATTAMQKTALTSRMESAKSAVRSAEDALISYAAVVTDLDRKERVLNVTIANTERTLAEISKNLPDRINEIRKGVTKDWDKFVAQAKDLGVNIKSAFDEKNFGDLDKYRTLLVGLQGDIQKAGDKAMRAKQAYDTAFESALKNIRGDTIATKAQLKAVEQGLSEVGKGTEEYRDRVVRASAAIAQWHKASDSVKKSLTELGHAATVLEAIELEKWAEGVNAQFDKLAVSGAEAMNKVSQGLSGEISKMFVEQFDKEFELREAHAEKIYDLDQQIADKRAETVLDQTNLAIYQEQRRVTEIERAIEKEIRARERAQEKAEQLFEDRVRQAQAEVRELERNIRMQMDMREEQMELELKFQYLTLKISEEEANKKIAIMRTERDAAAARNAETMDMRLKEISEEAAVGRRRLQQTRELNATLAAEQRAAMARQVQASAETVQQIRRDAGIIFQLTRGIAESLAESVSKGFLDILTQARSVKDAFIGIVRSMADTVLSIITDMVTQWIRKAALMATTGGGFNIGTFARALMGGGGMTGTGGVGAANMGVFGNVAMQGGAYGMAGTSAGATNALGGTGGAGAMMAGGVAAAGGGYAVGSLMASKFGRDSYFHSGGVGAASGAATGAAVGSIVPGIGTGVGAGIGAIAGAIGGWLQERKRRKEMAKERDAIIEDMGGLDEFKRKAEEAGVALDKFLDTKKSKVYAAELDKIQKAFIALDIKKFIEAQGGLEAIKDKAKEAGIELTKAFLDGTGEAADMQRELEKVAKALQLQEAKASLAQTVTQMDELRKRAVLVGYDLKKLYDTKTIEEFNAEQAKLNKLLEEQQRRLQGLGTAAQGIQQRIVGLQQFLGRGLKDVFATMGEEGQKEFAKAFEEAQKSGYGGGPLKFLMENLEEFKSSSAEFTGLFAKVQEGVDRVGVAVAATFGGILRETGDIMAAFNAVSGSLDMLAQIAQETGVEIKGSLKYLLEFRNTVRNNEDVANSLAGIQQILKGLSDSGRLTAEVFNTMSSGGL
jgi:predicted  nucleic acid-binding Zn-ribbon protein